MRALKKVLALTLVIAFAFTMMAGATVFTDDAKVNAQSQVNMISALGIVKGYPDGTFGPDKTITRAEAAKMLYVIKTGKDAGSDNYKNAANPFTDVTSSNWAKGYINYCYLNGIVAGVGGGKFNPEGQVTGAELAKMLLTVIGYDATKAKLTGSQWLISTMSLAFENKLFDNYTADVSAAAPREDAAIIFYNTVFTPTVALRDGAYVNYNTNNVDLPTVGAKNFALAEYEGTLLAADSFKLTGSIGEDQIAVDRNGNGAIDANETFDFVGGRDLVGQDVKVVYDTKKDVVYNIVPTGDSAVYNVAVGSIDANGANIKINDKTYTYPHATVAATAQFVNFAGTAGGAYDLTAKDSSDMARLVDTNDDGTIDFAFINARTFGHVSTLDSKSIDFGRGGVKFLNSDGDQVVFADGIAEGDYVLYYQDAVSGNYYLTKATTVSGTIDGLSGTKIRANGAYISKGTNAAAVGDAETGTPDLNNKYTVYTDGKYWLGFISNEASVAGAGNYALVTDVQNKSGSGIGASDPKVMVLIPGEDDPVEYVLDSGKVYNGVAGAGNALIDINKTNMDNADSTVGTQTNILGKVFAYSITSDGKIKLSQDFSNFTGNTIPVIAAGADTTGAVSVTYNSDADVFTAAGKDFLLADDAVIFYYVNGAWEVYGKNDFDANITTGQADLSAIAYKTSGGFNYIQTAIIADGVWNGIANVGAGVQNGGSSDELFGYMLSDAMLGHDAATDKDYVEYTIWNGQQTVIRDTDTSTIATGAVKGAFVDYKLKTDGTINTLTTTIANNATGDITGYSSATNKITISGTIYNITKDTVTIYIDKDAVTGETGSSYPHISASAVTAGDHNAYIVTDGAASKDLLVIIVDLSETL